MAFESRQLHCLAAGSICQHGHTLPGTVAAASLLSRQWHLYKNDIRLLRNSEGRSSEHNCQLTRSICVLVCGFAMPFKGLLRVLTEHL